jgi:hypothetical protein
MLKMGYLEEFVMIYSLRIDVGMAPDADAEDLYELVHHLRDELLGLAVGTVEWAPSALAPSGAKGFAGADTGSLIVRLLDSAAVGDLADILRHWVRHDKGRMVTIRIGADTLDVSEASVDEKTMTVERWLHWHADLLD